MARRGRAPQRPVSGAVSLGAATIRGGAPTALRIDSGGDQFPVSGPAPRLSWRPPVDAQVTGYELEATVDGATLTARTLR